jgi:hypothetical protein
LFENAGDARRLAASGDRAAALSSLSRDSWLALWEEAIVSLSGRLTDLAESAIDERAAAVRLPKRRRKKLALTDEDRRAVAGRLGSTGSDFVHVLDEVDNRARRVLEAHAGDRDALTDWQEALLRAARRLEHAWSRLEGALIEEMDYWSAAADRVGEWRKSQLPVVFFLIFGSALAVWLGLVFGGYVESPAWFSRAWNGLVSLIPESWIPYR